MEYSVTIKGKKYPVEVALKKMKKVRLKVFPSGGIRLSAPIDTPEVWISKYLRDKTPWIEEKLDLFVKTKAIEKEEHYSSGASTRILGRQMIVELHPSNRKQIIVEDGIIKVYTFENDQASRTSVAFPSYFMRLAIACIPIGSAERSGGATRNVPPQPQKIPISLGFLTF